MSSNEYEPLIPNGQPPVTVDVPGEVPYFDFEADQYKYMCNTMHSKKGVIEHTIFGYIQFAFSIPILAFLLSQPQLYILRVPAVFCVLFNLMLTVTQHSALTKEKHEMMIPSIICSLLDVMFLGLVDFVSVIVVVSGEGNNILKEIIEYLSHHEVHPRTDDVALYTISWLLIVFLSLLFVYCMWVLEIQWKYYNCIRDKKYFSQRTPSYYVNRSHVDPRASEDHV